MVGAIFLCSTCSASFERNSLRREHMREAWHVFNMQRKVAELPSISLQSYQSLVGSPDLETHLDRSTEQEEPSSKRRHTIPEAGNPEHDLTNQPIHDKDSGRDDDELLSQPERCLFCVATSETVDDCLVHMQQSHGFHIPRKSALQTDIETFLAYLNLVISRFHSCLYCGHEKYSSDAVRSHMVSKGHCMLDLSEGSDFLDFWDGEGDDLDGQVADDSAPTLKLSLTEMRLPSGSVASHRQDGRPTLRPWRSRKQPIESTALVPTSTHESPQPDETPTPTPQPSSNPRNSNALSKRDQMGIIGLSDSQQRSLAITHKKIVAREQRFRNEARWTVEKFGNTTKMRHFKVSRSGIHSAIQVC